jgi:hypothetical protein
MDLDPEAWLAEGRDQRPVLVFPLAQAADQRNLAPEPVRRKKAHGLRWIDHEGVPAPRVPPRDRERPRWHRGAERGGKAGREARLASGGMDRDMLANEVVEPVTAQVGVAGAHAGDEPGERPAALGRCRRLRA